MKIKDWFKRRKEQKFIKNAFPVARTFILNCNKRNGAEVIAALQELLDDYAAAYGKDDIYLHYLGRLEYFKLLNDWSAE